MERTTEAKRGAHITQKYDKEAVGRYEVQQLSRMPGHCPVSKCSDIVFPSNIMMHMLQKHASSARSTSSEIYEHRPLTIFIDPSSWKVGENHCVASLMYGGEKDRPETQPGLSYFSLPNSALINDHHKYDNYLPIMLMVCRATWFAHIKDKQLEHELANKNPCKAGIYVFWLVAPSTTRKLYYTLTIFDRHYISSRSVIRVVRNFTSLQNPSDFLPEDNNYMLLRDSEVLEFMNISKMSATTMGKQQKPGIPLELIVYQAPLKTKLHSHNQRDLQAALNQARSLYATYIMPRTKGSVRRGVSGKLSLTTKPRSNASGLLPQTIP